MNPLQKFYVDAAGNYLGSRVGYTDKKTREAVHGVVPDGFIEVPTPPEHRLQKWTGTGWDNTPPPPPPRDLFAEIAALASRVTALEADKARRVA